MVLNEHHFDEWKECRSSIARFDKAIVDLRKYGFTLITGLLTADAFLFAKIPESGLSPKEKAAVSIVTMALVSVLFVVDMQHEILLRGVVERAEAIESELNLKITTTISTIAKKSKIDTWGILLYSSFIFISAIPALFSTVEPNIKDITAKWEFIFFMILTPVVFFVFVLVYDCVTKK